MNASNLHHTRVLLLLIGQFVFTSVYSQFDLSFFDADRYDESLDSAQYQWHVDQLSYFRNTEYLSKVDVGSTYPGFHLLPYGQLQLNKNAQFFGGLFVRYDFGNPDIKTLEPYFKFKYRLWQHDIIFGNLEGSVQHRLIEPLYDYERAVTDRMEQGLQVKLEDHRVEWDFWIDWRQMIYQGDPKNEEMFAGLTLKLNPILNASTKWSINGQVITLHKAGELDVNSAPNVMSYNYSVGTELLHAFSPNLDLYLAAHQAYYYDHSPRQVFQWRNGEGVFGVVRLRLHEYALAINYWEGQRFQALLGERLYQSEGRKNVGKPIEYRKNLGIRLANELKVAHNLYFMSRIGVNINLDHDRTDVIMENYLRWHIRGPRKAWRTY